MTIDSDPKGECQQVPPWNNIVIQKRTTQLNLIPETWRLPAEVLANPPASSIEIIRASGILSTKELAWTETTDICDLVSLIKTRSITSEQLTTAFCKRAAISQQVNKCLTEIFFERALQRARDLDEILRRTGEVVGPLHGVPVSVKDRFDVEGVDTTVGMFSLLLFLVIRASLCFTR
jgi:amidase